MSYKLSQLSPRLSTRTIRMRIIPREFCLPLGAARHDHDELAKSFMQAWLEDDSKPATHLNWGAISGIALSLVVSASVWTALVLAVEKILK